MPKKARPLARRFDVLGSAMPRPAAIIFDLDDTLIVRSGGAREAWVAALATVPELTARHPIEAILETLSGARDRAWSDARRRAGPVLDYAGARAALIDDALGLLGFGGQAALAARINEAFAAHTGRNAELSPGSIEVLAALRGAGVPLAMLTNGESRTQRAKIERFALAQYFAHILVEEEIGAGKPFEPAYAAALAKLACPACDIWFVGDHLENDIAGPKRLGMRAVWYNPGGATPAQRHADAEIRALGELLDLLGRAADKVA
jgi:putative hydrolase of the HAD superfamily